MWETNEKGNRSSFLRKEIKSKSKKKITQQYPKANYRDLIEMLFETYFHKYYHGAYVTQP